MIPDSRSLAEQWGAKVEGRARVDIETIIAGNVGLGAITAAFVLAMLAGRLIARQVHLDRIADMKEQIRYLQLTVDKRDEQVAKLLTQGELTISLLEDLKRAGAAPVGRDP